MPLKSIIRKIVPRPIFSLYHLALAWLGTIIYDFPSRKMMIIGVTGSRGKTTTANYIWSVLTTAGYKVGQTGTANIRIGTKEIINPYHMTMPGRFTMQKLLAQMARAKCEIAIVETPSEGVEQFRHKGIAYDYMVFTVLYPEHMAIHNWDPERCAQKMAELFSELMKQPRKKLRGENIPKTIIVNADTDGFARFYDHEAEQKITYSINKPANIMASNINTLSTGVDFRVGDIFYTLNIPGEYNVMNTLPAIAIARSLKISEEAIINGISALANVPGRMEKIATDKPFTVYVDYAHDGPSFSAMLHSVRKMRSPGAKLIVTVGAEGGGRDKEKRPVMGELCAELTDFVIVTNVDPYEDDPRPILKDIADAAAANGKTIDKDLFVIEDRREGIKKALSLAHLDDIVVITGKGAEQSMEVGGHSIPWDDRAVVREELAKMSNG